MPQCVCGQYFNPGEAQCRFCGRILQDGFQGYDQYQGFPNQEGNFSASGAYPPEQQASAKSFDAARYQPFQGAQPSPGQTTNAPAGHPFPPFQPPQGTQPAFGQPLGESPNASQPASRPPSPSGQPLNPAQKQASAAQPAAKPSGKADLHPEVLSTLRILKQRSLIQLIVVIAGFAITAIASGWLIMILFAISEALKR